MNANRRSLEQQCDYVGDCLDFRPEENIFRIARDMFTEPGLFDLGMELIFEKNWICVCHESELARPHDFVTLRVECRPLIVTCDSGGQSHALANACQHRGVALVRVSEGNQSTFACPFRAWCYKNDGWPVRVRAPGEYPEGPGKAIRNLKKAHTQSYKDLIFVSLDVAGEDDLVDLLGDARAFLDMLMVQSSDGELEILPGISTYTYEDSWELQSENGLDGYHVSTVHYSHVATAQHRQQVGAERGGVAAIPGYSKLGAGDAATGDDWFSFINGHNVFFNEMPNSTVRPGYASVMPWLVVECGQTRAEWMTHRLRSFDLYPSLFVIDQISSQLCIIRPLAQDRTEIVSQCIGVKDEPDADRKNRIRQFEDFFNVSGMDMSDDPAEFREAQHGFQARLEHWSDVSRGHGRWFESVTLSSRVLDIAPLLTGTEIAHEGLYVNQHAH